MKYTKLVLSGQYHETGNQGNDLLSIGTDEGFRFDRFYIRTANILRKKSVTKVLVDCRTDFRTGLFAGLEEIRECLKKLADAGKDVIFYSPVYGPVQLYLASACTTRIIHPVGTVKFQGLAWSFTFLKKLFEKAGIEALVIRRGKYKSAGDQFSKESLDEHNREQYELYFKTVLDELKSGIISGYGMKEDALDSMLDGETFQAEDALGAGWVSSVSTLIDIESGFKKDKIKKTSVTDTAMKSALFAAKKGRVAVLVFEGAIVDGKSRRELLIGNAVGSNSFIPHIHKLKDDSSVKAVVLRINSGGGSPYASEDIRSALKLLAEKKPLYISMGEVAGSGGYWISCCGEQTLACNTSLTGSIGVISIYMAWYRLLEKLGVSGDLIKFGKYSDTGSPMRSLTDDEIKMLDSEIESMYSQFTSMVAKARNKTVDEIDLLGMGRIWSGCDARKNGLVDSCGFLTDAVKAAAEKAGIKVPIVKFYPEIKNNLLKKLIMKRPKDDDAADSGSIVKIPPFLLSGSVIEKSRGYSIMAVMEEVLHL